MHNVDTLNGLRCNLTIKVKNIEELEKFKNQVRKFKNVKVIEE